LLILSAFAAACTDAPLAPPDRSPNPSFKGGPPQVVNSRATLPTLAAAAGLYGDGAGEYTATGDIHIDVLCGSRTVAMNLAGTGWTTTGAAANCTTSNSGFVRLSTDNIINTNCADGQQCAIGTSGHNGTQDYSDDVYFYFQTDKDGDGRFGEKGEDSYNVVWVNATAEVLQRSAGTPCKWHVRGTNAEFWKRPDVQVLPATAAAALDVIARRIDLCP
jgi:hypothetical protein